MLRFSFVLSLFFLSYSTNAQDISTILYAKDSSSVIKLHNDLKIVYVFSDSEPYTTPEELPVLLSFEETSISIPTTTETATNNGRTITLGEFPSKLLDTKLKGHLLFGKMLLNALDTVGSDSMITLNTTIVLQDKTITGPLYLDFKGSPGIYEMYWNEVEYYLLLEEQAILQDSIVKLTADNQRAKALMDASNEYVVATATQVEVNQKELDKKYSQFNSTIKSLKKINTRMDDAFEKIKTGGKLTEEEKKQIAYLTTDGSQMKKELKQKANGSEALKVFEKMSSAMTQNKAAQKQYDNANQVFQDRDQHLKTFILKAEKTGERLKVLKKALQL
jgi:hypothetical protein